VTVPASLEELEIRVGDRRLARLTGGDLAPGEIGVWPLQAPESAAEARPKTD
jgi:hypothetical protein